MSTLRDLSIHLGGIISRKVDRALAEWIDAVSQAVGPGGVVSLGNFATGGSIGTAAATVDIASTILIAQTTAGQTLTLPNLTVSVIGQELEISNTGSQSFTLLGKVVAVGSTLFSIWNGAAWSPQV